MVDDEKTYTLLVDAKNVKQSLELDIEKAKKRVFVQTMTYEGDYAGAFLAELLITSSAGEKKLLIDSYSKIIQSDRFIYSPHHYFCREVIREKKTTRFLISKMRDCGVQVHFSNPLGLFLRKLTWRNHKKLVVIDDHVAYIGGINFSDHNFVWHDCMLRINNVDVARFLAMDFLTTWRGKNNAVSKKFNELEICLYDGPKERRIPDQIKNAIENAQKEILISSPYVTAPYFKLFQLAAKRGVVISLIIPEYNNRHIMTPYIQWHAARSGIKLYLYQPNMSHLKAMLVDDTCLIIGSSNFDYLSVHTQQEVFAFLSDFAVISEFKNRIWANDLNCSAPFTVAPPVIMGRVVDILLMILGKFSIWFGM